MSENNTAMKYPYIRTRATILVREALKRQCAAREQEEIAAEIGLSSSQLLIMMANGQARVPIDLIEPIAATLDLEPCELFDIVLEDHWPRILASLHNSSRNKLALERQVLNEIQRLVAQLEPPGGVPDDRTSVEDLDVAGHAAATEEAGAKTEEIVDLNFKVGRTFHQRFKLAAVHRGISMKAVLEAAFELYVDRYPVPAI